MCNSGFCSVSKTANHRVFSELKAGPITYTWVLIIMYAMFPSIHASVNLCIITFTIPLKSAGNPRKDCKLLTFQMQNRVTNYNRRTVDWKTIANALSRYLSVTYFIFNNSVPNCHIMVKIEEF